MRINLFAGARRLALLAAVGIAVAMTVGIATQRPYLTVGYFFLGSDPSLALLPYKDYCEYRHASFERKLMTPRGHEVSAKICSDLLKFEVTPEIEVAVAKRFAELDGSDKLHALDDEARRKVRNGRIEILSFGGGALLVLAVITWATGWVVRGFLGIPRGMDQPPKGKAHEPR